MPAKQGNSGNRVAAANLTRYALLTAACLIVGYVESLLPLAFIAPGVKLGLSNAVAMLLVLSGDTKGAFAVNITRILLSALLFGSIFSLIFSLSGGIFSLIAAAIFKRLKSLSAIGVSMISGVVHNIFQLISAVFITGAGVLYYIPILILSGAACGGLVGLLTKVLLKKLKTNRFF